MTDISATRRGKMKRLLFGRVCARSIVIKRFLKDATDVGIEAINAIAKRSKFERGKPVLAQRKEPQPLTFSIRQRGLEEPQPMK